MGETPLREAGPEEPVGAWRDRGSRAGGLRVYKDLRQKGVGRILRKLFSGAEAERTKKPTTTRNINKARPRVKVASPW